jgi:hypothetical protein
MTTLALAQVTVEQLARLAPLEGHPTATSPWNVFEQTPLTPEQEQHLTWITARIRAFHTTRANESTLWARAIYPLLMLAERGDVRAWSQVALKASFKAGDETVELVGVADGVLAREGGLGGDPWPPLLLVVEAKRAIDATDPAPQLLGALYVALQLDPRGEFEPTVCYGCYTVGDTWTFARATRTVERGAPRVVVDWSREYTERTEAAIILGILTAVVATSAEA